VTELTDEMLMAYADGELDAAARAEVERALEADPRASRRLQIFAATGAPLAKLFDAPMREPVPPRLLALLGAEAPSPRPGWRLLPTTLVAAARDMFFGGPRWASALAWSVPVLLIAGGLYWSLQRPAGETDPLVAMRQGQMFAQKPLAEALETAPSGSPVALGGALSGTMEAVLSFKSIGREFCRQYEVTTPAGAHAGIACRKADGRWQLVMHLPVAAPSSDHDRMAPAGRSSSAVDAAVGELIQGDALGPSDEQALIHNGWQR
jgi:anti-sigma factor RsiW